MKEKLIEILKKLKKEGKIKDYGFEEYLYWNNIPVIYFNNGGYIYLAKTHSESGTTNVWTLEDLKTERVLKEKINYILSKEDFILENCVSDLTKLELYKKY